MKKLFLFSLIFLTPYAHTMDVPQDVAQSNNPESVPLIARNSSTPASAPQSVPTAIAPAPTTQPQPTVAAAEEQTPFSGTLDELCPYCIIMTGIAGATNTLCLIS